MIRVAVAFVIGLAVMLCGCVQETQETGLEPGVTARAGWQSGGSAGDDPSGPIEVPAAASHPRGLPACTAQDFAAEGTSPVFTKYADLDGDNRQDAIMGYRATETDDLGEPVEPAHVELARWNGNEWEEWFGIPAPGGETGLDERSLAIAGDMNGDGIAELGLIFYGFGVSSRPETLYLWQVIDEGLEPGIQGEALDTSSDARIVIGNLMDYYPGVEIAVAEPVMGDEAHAAPHRYEIRVFGWQDGLYREVEVAAPEGLFRGPEEAIQHHLGDLGAQR